MKIALISALAVVIVGAVILFNFRRELPYSFDVVRTGNGVAVINVENWVNRNLELRIEQNGKLLGAGVIDPQTHSSLIDNLGAPGPSQIVIGRTDLLGRLLYKTKELSVDLNGQAQEYVILIGASIGYDWNLPGFPKRINTDRYVFGDRVKYVFDKSDLVDSVLNYRLKPKAVIIKECSAYFPRSTDDSVKYRKRWVEQLRSHGIIPIIATTTPVAKEPQNKAQQASIDEWNASIRNMAQKEKYYVLDLASALQRDSSDTFLKPGYFVDDGLHMTPLAYEEAFDPTLKSLLRELL